MTEDEIKGTGMPNQEGDIMKFTKTIYLPPQTVKTKIAKLVSISNIAPNKIAKDDEIQELIAAKYPKQKIPCSPDTVKKIVLNHSSEVAGLIKDKIKALLKDHSPVLMFDEWTSLANDRYINIIVRFGTQEFNIGLVYISGSATASNLANLIFQKVKEFGIEKNDVHFFTCDGAAVNKKIGSNEKIKLQLCMNHGIHLGK